MVTRMPRLQSLSLRVHVGRRSASWALVHRTDDGRTIWDRRLSSGSIDGPPASDSPQDLVALLRHVAETLEHTYGLRSPASGGREPLGAVGGSPTLPLQALCRTRCPACGEHLDGTSLRG